MLLKGEADFAALPRFGTDLNFAYYGDDLMPCTNLKSFSLTIFFNSERQRAAFPSVDRDSRH